MVEKNLEEHRALIAELEAFAQHFGESVCSRAAAVIAEQQAEIRDLQSELASYRGTVQSLFDVSRRLAEMAGAV